MPNFFSLFRFRPTSTRRSWVLAAPALLLSLTGTLLRPTGAHAQAATVATLAGTGTAGSTNGPAASASFNLPFGVAVDGSGNLYVADYGNNRIRRITAAGVVSTLAGSGVTGSTDGPGASASFNGPTSVAVDASGTVYVADYFNHKVRRITAAGVVSTLAGTGSAGTADGTGASAAFNQPNGVAVDAGGAVYVADRGNHKIRRITAAGVVSTLAGTGSAGSTDGPAASASFNLPNAVAIDASGTVYVCDKGNQKIRRITAAGVVSTLAGTGTVGNTDGTGTSAAFNNPGGVAVDVSGTVYVADFGNHKIRQITAAGVVSTLAGTGNAGSTDGPAASASFNRPNGVAVDGSGMVYVADQSNHKIRKITGIGLASRAATDGPLGASVVYPNPAQGTFAVQLPGVAGAAMVRAELLNTLGQVVRRQVAALPAAGTILPVEVAGLPAGVYTLRLQAGSATLGRRVVLY